jgi:ubiquinone/menaquinone biosynthesis C-methylase UbiE
MAGRFLSGWLDHLCCVALRRFFHNPWRILADFIKPGMTVLDIGFGSGYFSLEMARMLRSEGLVVCVEKEPDKVESLKSRVAEYGLSRLVDIRLCSDTSLAIDDLAGRIDFALAFFVVHHAADIPALMNGTYKALKRGGKLLIVEPRRHVSAEYCHLVEAVAGQAGLSIIGHPAITRTWTLLTTKS